jgi:hypothetical protein
MHKQTKKKKEIRVLTLFFNDTMINDNCNLLWASVLAVGRKKSMKRMHVRTENVSSLTVAQLKST